MNLAPLVWFIDDNPGDLDLYAIALADEHLQLRAFTDGRIAMDVLVSAADYELPDLILLDLRMPGLDGLQLLGLIEAEPRLEDLRICVVNSMELPPDHPLLAVLGPGAVFKKPGSVRDLDELRAVVLAALAGSVLPAMAVLRPC